MEFSTSIIITTYEDVGVPHFSSIRRNNPEKEIIIAEDKRKGNKRFLWRNTDVFMREWWKDNRNSIKTSHVLWIEWDVLITTEIPQYKGEGIAGAFIPHPLLIEWGWFREDIKLKGCKIKGLAPFGVLFANKKALDCIIHPKWDEYYQKDIFCELRTPSIVYTNDLPVDLIDLPYVGFSKNCIFDIKKGIYHPVKSSYLLT